MIFFNHQYFIKPNRNISLLIRNFTKSNKLGYGMPKDNKQHLLELQKQRKRIKAQSAKYAPSKICLQVLGNGTAADSRSVLLITDHTHYLFNCGEGTQRLCSEYRARLSRVDHILLTKPTWKNMGGLPGIALTLQDCGVQQVFLHGPEGSVDIIESTINFMTLNNLKVTPIDISKPFVDHTMTITYVNINNTSQPKDNETGNVALPVDNINYYDYEINCNGKRPFSSIASANLWASKSAKPKSRITSMLAYICKIHAKVGTLDIEKCRQAGVPFGPLMGLLKSGKDVPLPNGTILRSEDVLIKSETSPSFIVMECPDETWIDDIVQNEAFANFQQENSTDVNYIVHFSPQSVLNNEKYKQWMSKFGTKTHHLIINEDNGGFGSETIHKMQHQLHLLHPTIFPFLGGQEIFVKNEDVVDSVEDAKKQLKNVGDNFGSSENSEKKLNDNIEPNCSLETENSKLHIHHCKMLNKVEIRPHKGFDGESRVTIDPKSYVSNVFEIEGFLDSLADLQTELNAKEKLLGNAEEYPKLLMLGTGSAIPNKYRNTSGILLQINKDASIILDCGEGTVGQIMKFFGKSEAYRVLKTIKAVYVSHLHADHHIGFIGLLKEREKVTNEPLFLLAPEQIYQYLCFYHSRFEKILHQFQLISNKDILNGQIILPTSTKLKLYESLNIDNIDTAFVKHCPFAYGVAITLKDGRKICYSGDTIPCESFQKLANNSFLLIHEATMEDSLESEAQMKHHSTISQAIYVGVKAEAHFTLLTHFSQRYCKLPILPHDMDLSRVGIAYDFMYISLSKLELLPLLFPSLDLVFSEFRAILDNRNQKREWKKNLALNN